MASGRLITAGKLGVLGDVASLGRSILFLGDDGLVVSIASLIGLRIKFDAVEAYLGVEPGDKLSLLLSESTGEQDVLLVDLADVGNEPLRVVSAEVDTHVDLLLKVVVVLSRPWLGELSLGVLLEEGALLGLFFVAATHSVGLLTSDVI